MYQLRSDLGNKILINTTSIISLKTFLKKSYNCLNE